MARIVPELGLSDRARRPPSPHGEGGQGESTGPYREEVRPPMQEGRRKCSSRCTRYYYVLDAPPGPDGKRKQTWSKGYTTRKAAEVAVREELSRRDQGIVLSTEKLPVALEGPLVAAEDDHVVELHALPTIG